MAERIAAEQQNNHLASHDYLTGLPNRMLLMDRLQGSLARARAAMTRPHCLPLSISTASSN